MDDVARKLRELEETVAKLSDTIEALASVVDAVVDDAPEASIDLDGAACGAPRDDWTPL